MTGPTPDLDDLLRDALDAEAAGVTADDDLLRRIRERAEGPAAPGRRVLPWLVAAALVAVLGAAAFVLAGRDAADEPLDVVDQPAPPDTGEDDAGGDGDPEEDTPDPSLPIGVDDPLDGQPAPNPTPEAGPVPPVIVGATHDGRLVVVDTGTGMVLRELWALGDPFGPPDPETGIHPQHISAVTLHPDGSEVFVETCCEPAGGNIYRLALDGSTGTDPQPRFSGYGADISSDGRWLASVSGNLVFVFDLEEGVSRGFDTGETYYHRASVNHDGTQVALEEVTEYTDDFAPVRSEVRAFRLDGDQLVEIEGSRTEPEEGRAAAGFVDFGRDLATWQLPAGTRSLRSDASGAWHLVVDADGTLRGFPRDLRDGDDDERIVEVPDVRFLHADW